VRDHREKAPLTHSIGCWDVNVIMWMGRDIECSTGLRPAWTSRTCALLISNGRPLEVKEHADPEPRRGDGTDADGRIADCRRDPTDAARSSPVVSPHHLSPYLRTGQLPAPREVFIARSVVPTPQPPPPWLLDLIACCSEAGSNVHRVLHIGRSVESRLRECDDQPARRIRIEGIEHRCRVTADQQAETEYPGCVGRTRATGASDMR
jgi:hypothetical protein